MRRLITILSFLPVILTACGPKIYKSTQFESLASKDKIVAVLPAAVTLQLRPNEAKKVSIEEIKKNEESTGYSMQDEMYGWLLREQDKMKYTVKFQDVNKTNSILKNANISYSDLKTKSKQELANLLGVDAVISTSVRLEKPMSEGAAVTVGLLVGVWGSTNKANITIDIHEHTNGDLIWKYDYEASGSVFNSTEQLVKVLMRNASKKFPYNEKRG